MSIEILLDVLLSAVVLYVYHSDCAQEPSFALEFAGVTCSPEAYNFAVIPVAPIVTEWVLDADPIVGPAPDELIGSTIGELLGSPTTCIPVSPTTRPTVKQLRTAAKLLGVKNSSRMSKAELLGKVGGATLDLTEDGFSIT